jgi:DNA-binding MarR family transcriptional regulator
MLTAPDLRRIADCHCLAARRTARAITRLYDEKLRPQGLRATQFSVLAALAIQGPTPVSSLAEGLGMDRTTLTRSAALLEHRKWITTAPSADRRRRAWKLTATGMRKLESVLPAWQAAQDTASKAARGASRPASSVGRAG